jgi:phosphopantetheine--protein transferase-like protein
MFHGPSFQGVRSIDRTGKKSVTATIETGPSDAFFSGQPNPVFLTDPVILDAAGQVVAFWSQEHLDSTGDIFPYRLGSLDCFGPPPEPGTKVECRVIVRHVSDKEIHSDIEIVDPQGKLLYRLGSWEDRRFPQPSSFWALRLSPRDAFLSAPWRDPIAGFLDQRLACCRLDSFSQEFFESSHGIWPKVLAHLVLSRDERAQWNSMQATGKRKDDWLLGRCAAKDAVRMLVKKHFGLHLCPADVEIVPDAFGRPHVRGPWTRQIGVNPAVSISHTGRTAVALASLENGQMVGIDIESLSHSPEDFQSIAFSDRERSILGSIPQEMRREWSLRMWCAKEAVAKALGKGLAGGLQSLQVAEAEAENGIVQLELQDGLLQDFSQLRGRPMIAYTSRGDDLIFSTIVYQQGRVQ